ncbi:MAG: tetratricopeptide repeat protein, partial [Anaerolineae bacterium]|nr:tetratricopeptide repeat protein [Anaerolineae bacterium]
MQQNDAKHINLYRERCYNALVDGSLDEAKQHYQQALALASPEQYKQLTTALENAVKKRCDELEKAGQWEKAVKTLAYFNRTLFLDSQLVPRWQADVWMRQGHAERRAGKRNQAKTAYERAMELDPNLPRQIEIKIRLLPRWIWALALGLILLLCLINSLVIRPQRMAFRLTAAYVVAHAVTSTPIPTLSPTAAPSATPALDPTATPTPLPPSAPTATLTPVPTGTPTHTPATNTPTLS